MTTWRWELYKNGELEIVKYQTDDEFGRYGQLFMFSKVIPKEHKKAVKKGTWDSYGFHYSVDKDNFLVRYYRTKDNESIDLPENVRFAPRLGRCGGQYVILTCPICGGTRRILFSNYRSLVRNGRTPKTCSPACARELRRRRHKTTQN